jgi:hypothetical protein
MSLNGDKENSRKFNQESSLAKKERLKVHWCDAQTSKDEQKASLPISDVAPNIATAFPKAPPKEGTGSKVQLSPAKHSPPTNSLPTVFPKVPQKDDWLNEHSFPDLSPIFLDGKAEDKDSKAKGIETSLGGWLEGHLYSDSGTELVSSEHEKVRKQFNHSDAEWKRHSDIHAKVLAATKNHTSSVKSKSITPKKNKRAKGEGLVKVKAEKGLPLFAGQKPKPLDI